MEWLRRTCLDCNGAVYLDTDVPALAALIKVSGFVGYPGSDATHTAVPDLRGRFPIGRDGVGWTRGAMGGEYNHTLLSTEMPVHGHTAAQAAHTHSAYQDVHVHVAWQDAHAHAVGNTQAHSHVITTGNHSHAIHTGGHSHGLDHQVLTPNGGGNAAAGSGWVFSTIRTDAAGDLGGNTDAAGNLGGYTDTQALAVGNTDARHLTSTPTIASLRFTSTLRRRQ